jgi:prolyl-tRNA synthetase
LGQKFTEADLIGIPIRLLVSSRTGEKIEVKRRNEDKTEILNYEDIQKL